MSGVDEWKRGACDSWVKGNGGACEYLKKQKVGPWNDGKAAVFKLYTRFQEIQGLVGCEVIGIWRFFFVV